MRKMVFFCFLLVSALFIFSTAGTVCAENKIVKEDTVIYVSWGDSIVVEAGDAKLDTPEKIERMMEFWAKELKAKAVFWRVSDYMLRNYYKWDEVSPHFLNVCESILRKFDPMATAITTAHKYGMEIYAYDTIWDLGAPPKFKYMDKYLFQWQSYFTIEHPEYQVIDRSGKKYQYGVLELAYPEAREYLLSQMDALLKKYNFDGIYWCTRSHSAPAASGDEFGYNQPIVDEYQKRYGKNILKDDFDLDKWRLLRGEYFVEFIKEAKSRWPEKIMAVGIPRGRYFGPGYGNMYLDWEALVKNKLIDRLVLGVWSGAWLYPQRSADYAVQGYLCADEKNFNVPDWPEAIDQIYGPLCEKNKVKLSVFNGDRRLMNCKYLNSLMLDSPKAIRGITEVKHYDALSCQDGQMTVECRIWPRQFGCTVQSASQRILSKYGHAGGNSERGFELTLEADGKIVFRCYDPKTGNQYNIKSNTTVAMKTWSHIAAVTDAKSGKIKLYINGKLDTENNCKITGLQVNPSVNLYIGRYGGSNTMFFDGMIDELIIWNKAKSFETVPDRPYTKEELKEAVAAFNFDNADNGILINLATIGNPGKILQSNGNTDRNYQLSESTAEFGKALKIGIVADSK